MTFSLQDYILLGLNLKNIPQDLLEEQDSFCSSVDKDNAVIFVSQKETSTNLIDDSTDNKVQLWKSEKYHPAMAKFNKILFFISDRKVRENSALVGKLLINKNPDEAIVSESYQSPHLMQYGRLVQNNALSSVFILDNVLLPLLRQGKSLTTQGQESDLRSSLHLTYAKKFASRVCRFIEQTKTGTHLSTAKNIIFTDLNEMANDSLKVERLERLANEWHNVLAKSMETELSQQPLRDGPMGEVDFWRRRHVILSDLTEQIKIPSIENSLEVLNLAGSRMYNKVKETINILIKLAAEASDNAKFLSTVERHFRTINDGSITSMITTLPSLLDSLKMVWMVSRHYNTDERMVPMLERVAHQLTVAVRKNVGVQNILHQDLRKAKRIIFDSKNLLESWKKVFIKVKAQIENGGSGHRRWDFDRGRLFEKTDYIVSICSDLLDAIKFIKQLQLFLGPDLAAITGDTDRSDAVSLQVKSLSNYLSNFGYDPFNRSNHGRWSSTINDFHQRVSEVEGYAGESIEHAFQKLRSSEAAFNLVFKFQTLKSGPFTHFRIEERYQDILVQYSKELKMISFIFASNKENPPFYCGYHSISGSIVWADDLYHRAKSPIVRFQDCEGLLTSGKGDVIKKNYLIFARSINTFKDDLFNDWVESIEEIVYNGLREPLLVMLDEDGSVIAFESELNNLCKSINSQKKNNQTSTSAFLNMTISSLVSQNSCDFTTFVRPPLLSSNFSNKVSDMIAEAKHLDRLGYPVPEAAVHIALQENTYSSYTVNLNAMVKLYNSTLNSLSEIELVMMKEHISNVNRILRPGLTSLNWTSLRIPAFAANGNRIIENFRATLKEIRKHSSALEQIIKQIECQSLINAEDFCVDGVRSLNFVKFCNTVERKINEKIVGLAQEYQSIHPLILKVEMVVTESNEGSSIQLTSYYTYWEGRTYNAIVQVLLRSFTSLLCILRVSDKNSPHCLINAQLNEKDIMLDPSQKDLINKIHRCIYLIPESMKQIRRWMNGTCIETRSMHSFYDGILQNPAVELYIRRLKQEVSNMLEEVEAYLEKWRTWGDKHDIWLQIDAFSDSNLPIAFYEAKIEYFSNLPVCLEQEMCFKEDIPWEKKIHFLIVDFSNVASGMTDLAIQRKKYIGDMFHTTAKRELDSVTKTIKSSNDRLTEGEPATQNELKLLMNGISQIIYSSMDMELRCDDIKERYESLRSHEIYVSQEEIIAAFSVASHWQNLVVNAKTRDLRLLDIKKKFIESTHVRCVEFAEMTQTNKVNFREHGPGSSSINLERGLELVNEWEILINEMNSKKKELLESQDLFGLDLSSYPELNIIETEMKDLKHIYSVFESLKEIESSQDSCLWDDVDHYLLTNSVNALELLIKDNSSFTFRCVQERVLSFKEALPLLKKLKDHGIKPRHWEELAEVSNVKIDSSISDMTFGTVLIMNLCQYPIEVDKVINKAMHENKIESILKDIELFWATCNLITKRYGVNTNNEYILQSTDELILQLEDHLLNLTTLFGSKYVDIFRSQVKKWEKHLNLIAECLKVWFLLQQKWIYLERIFDRTGDIRIQLPNAANAFDDTSKAFQSIMNATNEEPNVLRACCTERRFEILQDLYANLEFCQKLLSDYLNVKRNAFARFFFISDDELISIMGSSDPTNIQPHLLKLFQNCKDLLFYDNQKQVVGMVSSESESFTFTNPVSIDGPIEDWMTMVENEMKYSLWHRTKDSIFWYAKKKRYDWIVDREILGMNTISGTQIWWTFEVEDAFLQFSNGEKKALRDLETKFNDQLTELVAMVCSPLEHVVRKKVNTLLIIDVHARDIVSSFVSESILSAKQFEWESQLKFYWDREEDDCIIKQCNGKFRYGYEYMGLGSRLVITPLTDRCYMTLTQALTMCLGGSPIGPAGTGKTETVKDLAKAFSIPCFVINCSEGLDYMTIGSTLSGFVQCGAWGCFDEFNRVNIEVLSVVSTQLKAIQNALVHNETVVNIGIGADIVIKRVKGFATCGIFVTMNPGYAGRTKLPDNLKSLFRPVTMIAPDLMKIAENLLFSEGFENSRSLAKKIVVLYNLSKVQLSKQTHYDFGLRSIKGILIMAGDQKRQYNTMAEDIVLMRLLRDSNLPKLVFDDVPLFLNLISDLFPGIECPKVENKILRKEIKAFLKKNGYCCSDEQILIDQVDRTVQLFETQKSRHTTMLVGPTQGGKSLVLQSLAKARLQSDGALIKFSLINPKAQTLSELYGELDETTRDWTDGFLSYIFRLHNQPLSEGRENEVQWIIFDGDVDPIWVENLNSVMDDNRLLTLPNGERIRLQPHCAIICEVCDLQFASPATISRCGMVWVDSKNLGFLPFYERWIRLRYGEHFVIPEKHDNQKIFFIEMFEKYAVPCIDFVLHGNGKGEEKLIQVITVGGVELCKQLCNLLHSFLPPISEEYDTSITYFENVYVYCVMWSIGAQLDLNSKKRFEIFLKGISPLNLPDGFLYDFYFSEEREWQPWDVKVKEYKQPDPFSFHEIFVPTSTSALYDDVLNRLICISPILFIGERGTAKTVTLDKFVASLPVDDFKKLKIIMSSNTKSHEVRKFLDCSIEKRVGNRFGAPSGKKLNIFVDDMHMPQVDPYGTQQPIALLLTLLDHGFMYTRNKNDIIQKYIKDISMVAAMGLPTGGIHPVDPRFIARFSTFYLAGSSDDVLRSIFSKIIGCRNPDCNVKSSEQITKISISTVKVFRCLIHSFPPTPSKLHYLFNMRDLGKVCEGICFTDPKIFHNERDLVRLWRHEMRCVFFDRLVTKDDYTLANTYLSDEIQRSFGDSSEYALRDPIVFGDFSESVELLIDEQSCAREYKDLGGYDYVGNIFTQILEIYNSSKNKEPLSIVLFEMALSHLVRICRVLRNPRGHLFLIGVGGSGKQSLSRLAAYTCGLQIFEITLNRGYSEVDFQEDLKKLFKQLCTIPVLFIFSDSHVLQEEFLDYISSMLTIGIPPRLFNEDEKESLCDEFIEKFSGADLNERWVSLEKTCLENLHVVLIMSPSGEMLSHRCRSYPSLISSCTIDWFFPWPKEALHEVATSFLNKDSNLSKDSIYSLSSHISFAHTTIHENAKAFRDQLSRPYFVTPKTYIDYITEFRNQVHSNTNKQDFSSNRLRNGLAKLSEASHVIDKMQIELKEKKKVVDSKTQDVEKLIETIQQKTKIAVDSNTEASAKKIAAQDQAKIIEEKKSRADSALMKALPAVEAAAEALNNIRREDLQELKAFNNPPVHVKIVCQMCTVLRPTDEKLCESWTGSKKMLGNARLLDLLKDYPKDKMTEKMYRTCKKILKDNKKHNLTVENMASKSTAGKGLLVWVLAILSYYEVAKDVQPLRERVKEMQKAQMKTEAELSELSELIKFLDKELKVLKYSYQQAKEDLANLQEQAGQMEKRITAASTLIGGLVGEKSRWNTDLTELGSSRSMIVGNSLLAASFLTYMGAFTVDYRQKMLHNNLLIDLKNRGILVMDDFNITKLLSTEVDIQKWIANGLPTDDFSLQNGILTMALSRFCLCIDPQQQALSWIQNLFKNYNLTTKNLQDSDFLKHLGLAIEFGNPLLVEDVGEYLDPVLNPILGKRIIMEDGHKTVLVGDKSVVWDDNFRLFFCTKLSNPKFSPEVMGKVNIINYCITTEGLTGQLLNTVISHERPELEEQFKELIRSMASNFSTLVTLEDSILKELSSTSGNILDNNHLIHTLQETKQNVDETKQKIQDAKLTKKSIDEARKVYAPVAKRGSILYFSSATLSLIDFMYEISLATFMIQFICSLNEAALSSTLKLRIQNLIDSSTKRIFDFTCIGIFNKDIMTYSFNLACMILDTSNELDKNSLSFFIKGDTSLIPHAVHEQKPNELLWLSTKCWEGFVHLTAINEHLLEMKNNLFRNTLLFHKWYSLDTPEESDIPSQITGNISALEKLCLLRVFRPDRCFNAAKIFVGKIMGKQFLQPPALDYKNVYARASNLNPTIFLLSPGADPQSSILKLGYELGFSSPKNFHSVSLGQGQGSVALKMIELASTKGHWVMLQNCHLLINWLSLLEKYLVQMKCPHKSFRLWLTSEPTYHFPLGLLQKSFKVVTEPPDGLKLQMKSALSKIDPLLFSDCQHPRFAPLVYALTFLHAVVQERRKYGKIGWNISYDFNESDHAISCKLLSFYLTKSVEDKDEVLPWQTLKYLIGDVMYGGRVSNDLDRRILSAYLDEYFGDFLFSETNKFYFSKDKFDYEIPQILKGNVRDYVDYVDIFPLAENPAVYGLHPNAEISYMMQKTNNLWSTLIPLQSESIESNNIESSEDKISSIVSNIISKIPLLKPDNSSFDLNDIKKKLQKQNKNKNLSPCQVFLLQELYYWNNLCKRMYTSLISLQQSLSGEIGMTERICEISNYLSNGLVPKFWTEIAPVTEKKLSSWMIHFNLRYDQYVNWIEHGEPNVIWLSGFHFPKSFLSALKQTISRKKGWALDNSAMCTVVTKYRDRKDVNTDNGNTLQNGKYLNGLFLEGAGWDIEKNEIKRQTPNVLIEELPLIEITYVENYKKKKKGTFKTPVYTTSSRQNSSGAGFVFEADLATSANKNLWILQGVAIIMNLSN